MKCRQNLTPDAILSPLVLGRVVSMQSSAGLNWRDILIERYVCIPNGEQAGKSIDRPVLVMVCSPISGLEHRIENGASELWKRTQRTLSIAPKGPLPNVRPLQRSDYLYCAFENSFISGVRSELDGPLLPSLDFHLRLQDFAASQILDVLFAEVQSGGASGTLYIECLAYALATRMLILNSQHRSYPEKAAQMTIHQLLRIQELIESRIATELSLQELAAEVGYSRSHFLRMFRATTGMSPHRYLLKRRIERAQRLLENSELSIAEIAYCCGFSSQAHLTLAFRRDKGLTPAAYRNK